MLGEGGKKYTKQIFHLSMQPLHDMFSLHLSFCLGHILHSLTIQSLSFVIFVFIENLVQCPVHIRRFLFASLSLSLSFSPTSFLLLIFLAFFFIEVQRKMLCFCLVADKKFLLKTISQQHKPANKTIHFSILLIFLLLWKM